MSRNAYNNNSQPKNKSFLDSYAKITPEQKKEDGKTNNSGEQLKTSSDRFKVVYGDTEYANSDVYAEAAKRRKERADNCADCEKAALAAAAASSAASGISAANRTGAVNANVAATNAAANRTGVITYSNSAYAEAAAINAAANRAGATNANVATTNAAANRTGVVTYSNNAYAEAAAINAAANRAGANQSAVDQHTDFYAHLLDPNRKLIRTEAFSYINEYDRANLKKFNVIIAALSKFAGTERLKRAFEGSGENLVVVRNDAGLYYVIIGSYDVEEQAVDKLRSIELEYNSRFTVAELKRLYGIPFTDLWILRR
jgi:hypothetical protein